MNEMEKARKRESKKRQTNANANAQVENVEDINMLIKCSRAVYTIKTSLIWTSNTYSDLCIV